MRFFYRELFVAEPTLKPVTYHLLIIEGIDYVTNENNLTRRSKIKTYSTV